MNSKSGKGVSASQVHALALGRLCFSGAGTAPNLSGNIKAAFGTADAPLNCATGSWAQLSVDNRKPSTGVIKLIEEPIGVLTTPTTQASVSIRTGGFFVTYLIGSIPLMNALWVANGLDLLAPLYVLFLPFVAMVILCMELLLSPNIVAGDVGSVGYFGVCLLLFWLLSDAILPFLMHFCLLVLLDWLLAAIFNSEVRAKMSAYPLAAET